MNKKSSLVKMMTWHQVGDETLLNLRWPCCLIDGLAWTGDAIWPHRSGSTLAQVMACCLTAPSHYLNQCWLVISKVQWESPQGNFTREFSVINHYNYLFKISWKSPRGQWVISYLYAENFNIMSCLCVRRSKICWLHPKGLFSNMS